MHIILKSISFYLHALRHDSKGIFGAYFAFMLPVLILVFTQAINYVSISQYDHMLITNSELAKQQIQKTFMNHCVTKYSNFTDCIGDVTALGVDIPERLCDHFETLIGNQFAAIFSPNCNAVNVVAPNIATFGSMSNGFIMVDVRVSIDIANNIDDLALLNVPLVGGVTIPPTLNTVARVLINVDYMES